MFCGKSFLFHYWKPSDICLWEQAVLYGLFASVPFTPYITKITCRMEWGCYLQYERRGLRSYILIMNPQVETFRCEPSRMTEHYMMTVQHLKNAANFTNNKHLRLHSITYKLFFRTISSCRLWMSKWKEKWQWVYDKHTKKTLKFDIGNSKMRIKI